MFKMDIAGNGVLVEKNCINKALGLKADCYSFERFRYICILSGCDYLASLPGIGLKKATLIFQRTRQPDMNVVCIGLVKCHKIVYRKFIFVYCEGKCLWVKM